MQILPFGDDADKCFEALDKEDKHLASGDNISVSLVTAKNESDLKHIWCRFFHNIKEVDWDWASSMSGQS